MKKILTISILAFSMNAFCQIPTNGLVAHYPFDGNANDLTGNGNNGTVSGAVLSNDRFGNPNSAYSFNPNDYIEVVDNSQFDFQALNEMSISFWMKAPINTPTTEVHIPISKQTGTGISQLGWNTFIEDGSGKMGMVVKNGTTGTQGYYQTPNTGFLNDAWHHVTFTFSNGTTKIYIDNVLLSVSTTSSVIIGNNAGNLRFGHVEWASLYSYLGLLDDILIYNRALNSAEVNGIYNGCTNPTATITAQSATTICSGNSVNLIANVGTGFTYQWYKDGSIISGQTSISYSASQSGDYTVNVIDGSCSALSSPVAVVVNQTPNNNVSLSGATTFCSGNSVTITTNGTGSYLWSNGATTNSITVNQNGNYSVVVSANGCSSSSTSTVVTVNPNPVVSFTGISNYTDISNSSVSLSGTPLGGTFSGNGMSGNIFNPTIAGLGEQTINYSFTNSFGCSSSTSQNTIVYDTLGVVCTSYDTITTTISDTNFVNVTQASIQDCFSTIDGIDNTWSGGWGYKEYVIPAGYKLDSIYGDFDRIGYPINQEDFILSFSIGAFFDINNAQSPFNYLTETNSLYDKWINVGSNNYTNSGVIRVFLPTNAGATWNNLCFSSSLISEMICTQTIYDTITTNVIIQDTNFVTITDTNFVTITDTNYVTITDTNFVSINDTIYTYISVTDTLIIEASLGLPSPNETNIIKIYPNPASTHISINTGNFALMTGYSIRIDNSLAQVVFTTPISQQDYFIDLSTWSGNGTYFVYILDSQQNIVEVKKIVLQ